MKDSKLHRDIVRELSEIIERRNPDILRFSNSWLMNLFWRIGNIIISGNNGGYEPGEQDLTIISQQLSGRYGGQLFSLNNLNNMQLLAARFPDISFVRAIACILGWQYFQLLMRIENFEIRCFYIDLTIKRGLTPDNLARLIKKSTNQSIAGNKDYLKFISVFKRNKNKWLLELQHKSPGNLNRNNKFKFPDILAEYADFFKSITSENPYSPKGDESARSELLLTSLIREIDEFGKKQNSMLNAFVCRSFYETGKFIHEYLLNNNKYPEKDTFIHSVSRRLMKKYGPNFSSENLRIMERFARKVDHSIAPIIWSLVSWEHIQSFLQLYGEDFPILNEDTLSEALSGDLLKVKDTEKFAVFEKLISETRSGLQSATIEIKEKKAGRNSVVIVNRYLDLHPFDNRLISNIFQSAFFPFVQKISRPSAKER